VRRRLLAHAAVGAVLLAAAAVASAGPPPEIEAGSVLVGNGANGRILYGEQQARRSAIASITKVMTALVVLERTQPDDVVTVGGPAPTIGESTIGLRAGERLTVRELLTAMLVYSANDAAYALAYHVGDGSIASFVGGMNAKARELGLGDTHFSRPDGLDAPGNHSSARDVFKLARVAMRKPLFRQLVRIRRTTVSGLTIRNRNDLLFSYPGTVGVKTGHTSDAGWSQVAAARRDGITIYAVLLGGPSREQRNADLVELLDWGFDQYRRVAVIRVGHTYAEALVPFSDRTLPLVAVEPAVAVTQLGQPLVERVVAPAMVALPIEKGQPLGEVHVYQGDKLVARRPLVAGESLERPSLGRRLRWYAESALDHARDALGSLFGFLL
jgi:D-alanyl-D-alanine carboxypeptidase (penicillin-binding protein 5/6)